jgi:hypothetical protein
VEKLEGRNHEKNTDRSGAASPVAPIPAETPLQQTTTNASPESTPDTTTAVTPLTANEPALTADELAELACLQKVHDDLYRHTGKRPPLKALEGMHEGRKITNYMVRKYRRHLKRSKPDS